MNSFRSTLTRLGIHLLVATPLALWGLYIVANATGGFSVVSRLLFAFFLIGMAGIIVAPALAALIALPTGIIYFPEKRLKPSEVVWAPALMKLRQKRYVDAIDEYRSFAKACSNPAGTYARMLEIAINHKEDYPLAEQVLAEGIAIIDEKDKKRALKQYHDELVARKRFRRRARYRPKIAIDPEALAGELEAERRHARESVSPKRETAEES